MGIAIGRNFKACLRRGLAQTHKVLAVLVSKRNERGEGAMMKKVLPAISKLAPGSKLAPTMLIPSMGLVWFAQSQLWQTPALQGGVLIVALAALCLTVLLDTLKANIESRQLGATPAHLRELVEAIASDNPSMNRAISQPATDVYTAIRTIQQDLQHRNKKERMKGVASERIEQALNTVGATVLVSDENCNIVYINQAGGSLFRETAADIRKDLSGFDADDLLGKSLGLFFKSPIQKRRITNNLCSEYRTEITFGVRTFSVIANPLFSENGRRLGITMEWLERSAELAVEEDIIRVVDSALAGDLGQRIVVENRNGFLKTICKRVNELIGLTDQVITDTVLRLGALTASSNEVVRVNTNVKRWARQQATGLGKTASAMSELNDIASRNTARAADVARLGRRVKRQAAKGVVVAEQTVATMHDINESKRDVANIIDTVARIASQMNVLAVNTSLAVAHVDESDNAFTDLAAEMRSLAGRSAKSAREIKGLLVSSLATADNGMRLFNKSGESLSNISDDVMRVTGLIGDIAIECKEQVQDLGGVCQAILRKNKLQQNYSAPIKQAESATTSLTVSLGELDQLTRFFTQNGGAAVNRAYPSRSQAKQIVTATARSGSRIAPGKKTPQLTLLKFPKTAALDD